MRKVSIPIWIVVIVEPEEQAFFFDTEEKAAQAFAEFEEVGMDVYLAIATHRIGSEVK